MVFVMDQYELSLLVVGFILLIQALQELFVMPQSSSQLLFSMFESLYRNHQFNFQILLTSITLYNYRMSCCLLGLGDEFGYWVKPRSTMWFNHFLLTKYENNRWIEHFQMSKDTFMDICNQVKPLISKHDNRYRKTFFC